MLAARATFRLPAGLVRLATLEVSTHTNRMLHKL